MECMTQTEVDFSFCLLFLRSKAMKNDEMNFKHRKLIQQIKSRLFCYDFIFDEEEPLKNLLKTSFCDVFL